MAHAVDAINGHGPCYEMCCQPQPKKTKVILLLILRKQSLVFYMGDESFKGDWFIVTLTVITSKALYLYCF